MKKVSLFLLFLLVIMPLSANYLNLKDLELLLSSNNLDKANTILSAKEFYFQEVEEYSDSEYGETLYTWGDNNNIYESDSRIHLTIESQGNGQVNNILLVLFDIRAYSLIRGQFENNGYEYLSTKTNHIVREGDKQTEINTIFTNSKYILSVCSVRFEESSFWTIEMFRKGSRQDKYNGIKKEFFENGDIRISYKIRDGFLDGRYVEYIDYDETEPYMIIYPNEDKWCYEIYSLFNHNQLTFKGTSVRSKIDMHKENHLVGYGTIYKFENGEWKQKTGKVNIRIIPAVFYAPNNVTKLVVCADIISN